jgi:hypothetical protein
MSMETPRRSQSQIIDLVGRASSGRRRGKGLAGRGYAQIASSQVTDCLRA